MKKLIAIGLAGLLGCTSGSHGPVVSDIPQVEGPKSRFPAWVEVPAWIEQQSEPAGNRPTVKVVASVCTWSAMEPDGPVFSHDGYAILGEAETDQIMKKLQGYTSASKLTAPGVIAGLGEGSSVAILSPDEPRRGVVFFMSPTTIDEEGVDLRFSLQYASDAPEENQSIYARPRLGTGKLEGHAKFGVGQYYVRAMETDSPRPGTEIVLFIQVARLDYPSSF